MHQNAFARPEKPPQRLEAGKVDGKPADFQAEEKETAASDAEVPLRNPALKHKTQGAASLRGLVQQEGAVRGSSLAPLHP